MKTARYKSMGVGLFVGVLCSGFYAQSTPSASRSKVLPTLTKEVRVSITSPGGGYCSTTASFPVKPGSKPTISIRWNGYGFFCKEDSGRTFWRCSNDLPFGFGKRLKAQFVITRKIVVTDAKGTPKSSYSKRKVTVQRGVPLQL